MHSYFFQLMAIGISIGVGLAIEGAMDDRFSGGVAEEERLPRRREDDDGGLTAGQNAELTGLLEDASSPLGER